MRMFWTKFADCYHQYGELGYPEGNVNMKKKKNFQNKKGGTWLKKLSMLIAR